ANRPAGRISAPWRSWVLGVRREPGQGAVGGARLTPPEALARISLPQSLSHPPEDPATQRAGFYGLGMNVGYTDFGTIQWDHSGQFPTGAAAAVFLLPQAGFGTLALTNGPAVGAAEAWCLSVLDLA